MMVETCLNAHGKEPRRSDWRPKKGLFTEWDPKVGGWGPTTYMTWRDWLSFNSGDPSSTYQGRGRKHKVLGLLGRIRGSSYLLVSFFLISKLSDLLKIREDSVTSEVWGLWRKHERERRETSSANIESAGRLKLKIMRLWYYQSAQVFSVHLFICLEAWSTSSLPSFWKKGRHGYTHYRVRPCWEGPAWQLHL